MTAAIRNQVSVAGARVGHEPSAIYFNQQPWADQALCAQTDPELFFPGKGGSTRDAKKVCLECPVTTLCLTWAIEQEEADGVWGGMSERERRYLIRKKRAAEQPDRARNLTVTRDCGHCGDTFSTTSPRARWCSASCRSKGQYAERVAKEAAA